MTGQEMHSLAARLYPICRSITGPGVRETLNILQEFIPMPVKAIPSGTDVLDWVVPDEWTARSAWIADTIGNRLVDFAENNLHLLQYSQPFQGRVSRAELEAHLFTLPHQPDLIPYKTSYYQKQWGFCLSEYQKKKLTDGEYDVCIDVSLEPGVLNYGEFYIPGKNKEEILISTHICHPSLANDNLSGIVVALACARHFAENPSYYSLRFIFVPGTIGAIAWLALNRKSTGLIKHGLVLTGLGAGKRFTYKKSREEDAVVDQMVENLLQESGLTSEVEPFVPYGYDERQYNSPGFALPVGCLARLPYGFYPEYHTSADNLDFIKPEALAESLALVDQIINRLCLNRTYQNLLPHGEPQLGKRGLYAPEPAKNLALLWVLNLSDGNHSILDISRRSKMAFDEIQLAAERLLAAGVLSLVR